MTLNYSAIRKMLGNEVFGTARNSDGSLVIVQFEGKDDCGDPIYKATWESKRNSSVIWNVTHYYYNDGTVEELFEHEYR